MTKKTKAKKTAVADGVELEAIAHPGDDDGAEIDPGDINPGALETIEIDVEVPKAGPDYHVTETGDIVLTATGAPVPEDHPVHPAHRALAAARKYCK